MPVLLLHPEDKFPTQPLALRYDAIVDLGRAPESLYKVMSERLGAPVYSIYDLAVEVHDLQSWRPLLRHGMGIVVDHLGIDWWDVLSILIQPDLQEIRLVLRLAEKLVGCTELVATKRSPIVDALRIQLKSSLRLLGGSKAGRTHAILRRGRAAADLGFVQARQVVYDKYDPHYRWRSKFAKAPGRLTKLESLVLLPTAYSNVTKTALSYARMLPEQKFLLAVARESAETSPLPANVEHVQLAAFASKRHDRGELRGLEQKWKQMESALLNVPEFKLSIEAGILQKGAAWLRRGLSIRDAWQRLLETRSIVGCLSADDSNPYTRLPLLLAERRGIPAVTCHHGALDGRMAFKSLPFSTYLAKGEMEADYLDHICGVDRSRIQIGAPARPHGESDLRWNQSAPWITFFTEPYESDFWRVDAIYREILPRLITIARRLGKSVVMKLHPFESAALRRRLLSQLLTPDDQKLVDVMDGPLSREILNNTWCAITVESTVAFECAASGIPAFLCGWLRHALAGYVSQYVRFGVAELLESADDLLQIPELIGRHRARKIVNSLIQEISPQTLSRTLLPTDFPLEAV